MKDYPYVLSSLTELEPSARLRVVLPEDAYAASFEIIDGLEELKHLALQGPESFTACTKLVASLREKEKDLQAYLEKEYRSTFD